MSGEVGAATAKSSSAEPSIVSRQLDTAGGPGGKRLRDILDPEGR